MMTTEHSISRRSFLALLGAAPLTFGKPARQKIPVGLELYSVRDELGKDLMGTVRAVAKMGYEVVEFYSPYYDWTPDYAKEVRKLLDDLGILCRSTHNSAKAFDSEGKLLGTATSSTKQTTLGPNDKAEINLEFLTVTGPLIQQVKKHEVAVVEAPPKP